MRFFFAVLPSDPCSVMRLPREPNCVAVAAVPSPVRLLRAGALLPAGAGAGPS